MDCPRICMFYCSNCLDRDEIIQYCEQLGVDKRMAISLPCSGKVNIQYLVKAFETGAAGVVVLTCELDECRHLEGNKRAKKRVQAVDSLLEEIGIGTGRITVLEVRKNRYEETAALIEDFIGKVQQISSGNHVEAGK